MVNRPLQFFNFQNWDLINGERPQWPGKQPKLKTQKLYSALEHGLNDTLKTLFSNLPELVNLLSIPECG